MADRVACSVKFYMADRAYGFLQPENGGEDVFVHLKDLKATGIRALLKEQKVSCEIVPGRDGRPKAVNVRLEK